MMTKATEADAKTIGGLKSAAEQDVVVVVVVAATPQLLPSLRPPYQFSPPSHTCSCAQAPERVRV